MDTREKQELLEIELMIGKILRIGVLVSSAVIIFGLVLFIVTGESGYPGETYPFHIVDIWRGLQEMRPFAWLMSGLILLLMTPVLRVVASIFSFLKEKDYLYVVITCIVLAVLVFAISIGHAGVE